MLPIDPRVHTTQHFRARSRQDSPISRIDIRRGTRNAHTHVDLQVAVRRQDRAVDEALGTAILFDLVFVPQHDSCTSLGNVQFTEGVLSPSLESQPDPMRGVILLGGTNRHFDWNSTEIISAVTNIARRNPTKTWAVCDSPRTPIDCLSGIESQDNIAKYPWQETNESFLTELLAVSSATWVTCDSVTMLYEALATKAQVGVLMLDSNRTHARPNKLLRGINKLSAANRVHLSTLGYELERADLDLLTESEVQRCAEIVIRQLVSN